jgi:membrane protein
MAVMLAYLKVPLTWREIFSRTGREAMADNVFGMAAQLSYYFFFALFPALLLLITIASYFPVHTLVDEVFKSMGGFAPPAALAIITEQIQKITQAKPGGLLTFGIAAAIWSTSSAMGAIINTLNSAYDIEEGRPWWKVQLTATLLTLGVALFILVSFALVIVGPTLAGRVADWVHLGAAFEWTWKILQWPFVYALACTGIALVYYFAPDAEQDWVWLTPGSVFATTLWLLASLAFKYYVVNITDYAATYGAIGGVMVLMLWLYISGTVILFGAEMNAEIEHASPYGKEPGEKVPGQKRLIGTAAMRAWIARRRRHGEKPPSADEVKEVAELQPAAAAVTAAKKPGAEPPPAAPLRPVPAVAMHATPAVQVPSPATAHRASDWLLGIAFTATQFWLTLKALRKTRA